MLDGPGMAAPQWLSSTHIVMLVVVEREFYGVPSGLCKTGMFNITWGEDDTIGMRYEISLSSKCHLFLTITQS